MKDLIIITAREYGSGIFNAVRVLKDVATVFEEAGGR
jgi:hypothetical protein